MDQIANSDATNSLPDDGPWADALGVHGLVVWSRHALLSMDLGGWESMADGPEGWIGDNGPLLDEPQSPTRSMLQDLMDGPMVGTGIGRTR